MVKKVGNDAGHGIDTFPPSKGIYKNGVGYAEHTFNAQVVIKIREHLQRHGVYSMEAQTPNKADVDLNKRTAYYNAHNVDLVWSTHANYNSNKAVKGMGIFYWKGTAKGKAIAEYYIKLCREAGLPIWGSGVFESTNVPVNNWTNFAITRDTNAVALLAENGFFSNDEDFERLFNTPSYIDLVGEISAKSILYGIDVEWKPLKPEVIAVSNPVKEEVELLKQAIVIGSQNDYAVAEVLANRIDAPIYPRGAINGEVAKELIVVGGDAKGLVADKITNLSGKDRFETAANVAKYL